MLVCPIEPAKCKLLLVMGSVTDSRENSQRIVHPAHIPLVRKAQAASSVGLDTPGQAVDSSATLSVIREAFRNRHVEISDKLNRFEIFTATEVVEPRAILTSNPDKIERLHPRGRRWKAV